MDEKKKKKNLQPLAHLPYPETVSSSQTFIWPESDNESQCPDLRQNNFSLNWCNADVCTTSHATSNKIKENDVPSPLGVRCNTCGSVKGHDNDGDPDFYSFSLGVTNNSSPARITLNITN